MEQRAGEGGAASAALLESIGTGNSARAFRALSELHFTVGKRSAALDGHCTSPVSTWTRSGRFRGTSLPADPGNGELRRIAFAVRLRAERQRCRIVGAWLDAALSAERRERRSSRDTARGNRLEADLSPPTVE